MDIGDYEYIRGLTRMASACAEGIGPSYMQADCFDLDTWREDFVRDYGLPAGAAVWIPTEETLMQVLMAWMGEARPKVAWNLIHLLGFRAGTPRRVFRVSEDSPLPGLLSWSDGGKGPFYTFEDICVAEFDGMAVCFMLGNDE